MQSPPALWIGTVLVMALGSGARSQDQQSLDRYFGPFVESGQEEFSGRMLVSPRRDDAGEVDRVQVLAALAPYQVLEHEPLIDQYVIQLAPGDREDDVGAQLRETGLFAYAHPDWLLHPLGCPDDPRFSQQWHHVSSRMNSCAAWGMHTGRAPVTIAICDTGVRITHEDLRMHRAEGYNSVDRTWERAGGAVGAKTSHGTQTTGCVAANGDNGRGVVGVGWNLQHRMCRVTNRSDGVANLSDLLNAALTGIQAGDKVANVSFSGVNNPAVRNTAQTIWNLGGLLVWSMGNSGQRLNWGDRDNDKLIAVGATDPNDTKASYSNYGPSMDVVAPGTGIWTTTSSSDTAYTNPSGTSFSAPLVAGLAGLLWSANPNMTPRRVSNLIKNNCDDLGASGPDDSFGYGRIDGNASMVNVSNPRTGLQMLVSFKNNVTPKGGFDVFDEDVVLYDLDTRTFSMYFDGSDVLSGDPDLDAVTLMSNGDLLMSFMDTTTVSGPGTVEDEDVIRFSPTSLGSNTAGTFSMYFDGSDVGLDTTGGEDLNGISQNANGRLLFTVVGKMDAQGLVARNEDVVLFVDTSLGTNTAGSFDLLFDGSDADAQLNGKGEQIDAYDFDASGFSHCFSVVTAFSSPVSVSGLDEDLGRFQVYQSGRQTQGWMMLDLVGKDLGLGREDVDAIYVFP